MLQGRLLQTLLPWRRDVRWRNVCCCREPVQWSVSQSPSWRVCSARRSIRRSDGVVDSAVHSQRLREGSMETSRVFLLIRYYVVAGTNGLIYIYTVSPQKIISVFFSCNLSSDVDNFSRKRYSVIRQSKAGLFSTSPNWCFWATWRNRKHENCIFSFKRCSLRDFANWHSEKLWNYYSYTAKPPWLAVRSTSCNKLRG